MQLEEEEKRHGFNEGRLVSFRSERSDSLEVGKGSIRFFRSACIVGCHTGKGAGVQSPEISIFVRGGKGFCDCKRGLPEMERPRVVYVDA